MTNLKESMLEIEAKLRKAADAYYNTDSPEMPDSDYDALLWHLAKLEEMFPGSSSLDSPTKKVGAIPNGEKVKHKYRMLSLGNIFNIDELSPFFRDRLQKMGVKTPATIIGEYKYDGLAVSAHYKDGVLVTLSTRGDGTEGENITHNAAFIKGLPITLEGDKHPDEIIVRGEVFMTHADFERDNLIRATGGLPKYLNARNAAAGILRSQSIDAKVVGPSLSFNPYEVPFATGEYSKPLHSEQMVVLEQFGFPKVLIKPIINDSDFTLFCEEAYKLRQEQELDFDIDGLVFKIDEVAIRQQLGYSSRVPRWAIAYKFPSTSKTTVVNTVDWQVGRTGKLTPVANLDPIELNGTVVRRATLHNDAEIRRLGLAVGDTVLIHKGGEIIPKITGVVIELRPKDAVQIQAPTHCPICETPVVKNEDVDLYCPNPDCAAKVLAKIEHFVSRATFDIKGIGPELIIDLVDAFGVKNGSDLYRLTLEDLLGEDIGEKTSEKVIAAIQKSKKISFDRFLFGLGIPELGASRAKTVALKAKTVEGLSFDPAWYRKLPDFGEKTAAIVAQGFADVKGEIDALLKAGVTPLPVSEVTQGPLFDKSAVVTGTFEEHSRTDVEDILRSFGAKVTSKVTSKTDLVVAGEKAGKKLGDAKQHGIKIISINDLLKLKE